MLHVEQQVTSLEEWSNDFTTNLNVLEARVDILETVEGRAGSEPVRFNRQLGWTQILTASWLWVSL